MGKCVFGGLQPDIHARRKLIYFIYLQLTIRWLIKHFTVIYADANKQFLILNLIFFCREKISLSGTPISLPKIADLPVWAQENITCMQPDKMETGLLSYRELARVLKLY